MPAVPKQSILLNNTDQIVAYNLLCPHMLSNLLIAVCTLCTVMSRTINTTFSSNNIVITFEMSSYNEDEMMGIVARFDFAVIANLRVRLQGFRNNGFAEIRHQSAESV